MSIHANNGLGPEAEQLVYNNYPNTCKYCHHDLTYNQWLKEDCDVAENGVHQTQLEEGPSFRCPECGLEWPDDIRVASGMKCAGCAGYAETAHEGER